MLFLGHFDDPLGTKYMAQFALSNPPRRYLRQTRPDGTMALLRGCGNRLQNLSDLPMRTIHDALEEPDIGRTILGTIRSV